NTGSQPNTSSADEFAAISDLGREAGEMLVILKRYARTIFTPLICQTVKEQIGLAKQEPLATMKE
nr:calmodulin-binding protein 60 [Tanacetum cinerariifolium]